MTAADTFRQALDRFDQDGALRADPAATLAGYCALILAPAAPDIDVEKVWTGAQARQMNVADLGALLPAGPQALRLLYPTST